MTREEIIDLTGEDPEDMFGPDWQNEVDEILDESDYYHNQEGNDN